MYLSLFHQYLQFNDVRFIHSLTFTNFVSASFAVGEGDANEDDESPAEQEPSLSPWSRKMVVGLCAGLTLVIILIVGLIVFCRYNVRKRKLKMEFEDDLEMYRNR